MDCPSGNSSSEKEEHISFLILPSVAYFTVFSQLCRSENQVRQALLEAQEWNKIFTNKYLSTRTNQQTVNAEYFVVV